MTVSLCAHTVGQKVGHFEWQDFPGGLDGKDLPAMQETQVQSLGQEDSLEKGMGTTPLFLPGEFHGQRSLAGYSPRGHKELDTLATNTSTFHFHPFQEHVVGNRHSGWTK